MRNLMKLSTAIEALKSRMDALDGQQLEEGGRDTEVWYEEVNDRLTSIEDRLEKLEGFLGKSVSCLPEAEEVDPLP